MEKLSNIKLSGVVTKLQTTVDGGWRVSIDIDASQGLEVAKLGFVRNRLLSLDIGFPETDSALDDNRFYSDGF